MGRGPITKALYPPHCVPIQRSVFILSRPVLAPFLPRFTVFLARAKIFGGTESVEEARHFGRAFFLSVGQHVALPHCQILGASASAASLFVVMEGMFRTAWLRLRSSLPLADFGWIAHRATSRRCGCSRSDIPNQRHREGSERSRAPTGAIFSSYHAGGFGER